jgi:hypothetical protein
MDVVLGQPGKPTAAQAVKTRVANMENVRLPAAQDDRGERRRHAGARRLGPPLGMDPAIDRLGGIASGSADADRLATAEIEVDEAAHRGLGRDAPARCAADAVGDGRHGSLPGTLRRRPDPGADIVLVCHPSSRLAAPADAELELPCGRHSLLSLRLI